MNLQFPPNSKLSWVIVLFLTSPVLVSVLDIVKQGLISRNVAAATAAHFGYPSTVFADVVKNSTADHLQPLVFAPMAGGSTTSPLEENKVAYRQISQEYWNYLQELERQDRIRQAQLPKGQVVKDLPVASCHELKMSGAGSKQLVVPHGYVAVQCGRSSKLIERPIKITLNKPAQDYSRA